MRISDWSSDVCSSDLMADTPLTLAETASVFGEMLTFQAMLRRTTDKTSRRAMLAAKIEDMLNTVVRQVAFCEFERQVHDERRQGELSADRIGEIWMETQTESLGPALRFRDRSEEHTSELQSLMRSSYAVFCLKKKTTYTQKNK